MRKAIFVIAWISAAALQMQSAEASTFNWVFKGTQGAQTVWGSGTVTATDSGVMAADSAAGGTQYEKYLVTDITGSFTNSNMTATFTILGLNTNLSVYGNIDNLLFYNTGQGAADLSGIGFTLSEFYNSNTYTMYNGSPLYGNFQCLNLNSCFINFEGIGSGGVFFTNGLVGGSDEQYIVTLSLAAPTDTPLPVALPLFASGLGTLALLLRRTNRKRDALATSPK